MNSLQYIAENWPLQVRCSNDIVRSLWRELMRYAGQDAAERAFRRIHGDTTKLKSFRNCIEMADEYYAAYEEASETIDPVLLYYGSMWLGHAAIYISLPPTTDCADVHGLIPKIDVGAKYPFLQAKIQVKGANEKFSLVNRAFGGDDVSGKTYDVLKFLAAIPDLENDLKSIGCNESFPLQVVPFAQTNAHEEKGYISAQIYPLEYATDGYFRQNVAAYEYLQAHNLTFNPSGQVSWRRKRKAADELRAVLLSSGSDFYFAPRIGRQYISEFALYFGLVHVLDTLCRYYPDIWFDLLERGGDEHFIIKQFLNLAEERLPNILLDHLSRETFVFRSKA